MRAQKAAVIKAKAVIARARVITQVRNPAAAIIITVINQSHAQNLSILRATILADATASMTPRAIVIVTLPIITQTVPVHLTEAEAAVAVAIIVAIVIITPHAQMMTMIK